MVRAVLRFGRVAVPPRVYFHVPNRGTPVSRTDSMWCVVRRLLLSSRTWEGSKSELASRWGTVVSLELRRRTQGDFCPPTHLPIPKLNLRSAAARADQRVAFSITRRMFLS